MGSDSSSCCSSNNSCCSPRAEKKIITIDFLYLDLSVCERCQGAENNLDKAIDEVSGVLKAAGFEIIVNKINVISKELAIKYEFLSSPTIRINGNDIELEVKESSCKECGDLCGDDVDCRIWMHEGVEYNEPPKEMIINAILKEVYGDRKADTVKKGEYVLPYDLQVFFDGLNNK
ncbi:hypothetical protein GCM10008905_02200 [Clostridium malenominatum]|uniref:Ferredoxin n=1 Tax=Clostridium malenominatum TaxID=1539 RepID=A0ABP3TT29_9CLOT